jgi:hypothetical protein|nr:MAG TPA: hypothetical protein [Caudoviricetes sp.]
MYCEKMTYTDFDGNEHEEELRFNLTQAELLEWELTTEGGMQKLLEKIVAEKDKVKLAEMFRTIILKAYGVKSADGKRFVKVIDGHRVSEDFAQTQVYSDFMMSLFTDPQKQIDFVNAIVPQVQKNEGSPVPPAVLK